MSIAHQSSFARHFLGHQRVWMVGLVLIWMTLNVLVIATSVLMEDARDGLQLQIWEPFCWEITSSIMILLLIPVILWCIDHLIEPLALAAQLASHLLLTLPFSLLHVGGMVSLRKIWYWLMDSQYRLGDLPYELIYEYRKDAQTYFVMVAVIYCARFIVRRLHGEASIVSEGEDGGDSGGGLEQGGSLSDVHPERLLIKKLGKEFLINVDDIEWIEAAGNYANLHIGNNLYPMRITMAKLQQSLPEQTFARIHRSSIVNLNQVKMLAALETGDYELTLHCGETLSLSRRYREQFKELLSL